jgi:hypothetical protein
MNPTWNAYQWRILDKYQAQALFALRALPNIDGPPRPLVQTIDGTWHVRDDEAGTITTAALQAIGIRIIVESR